MRLKLDYVWPFVGLAAVAFSLYLLSREFNNPDHPVSLADVWQALRALSPAALVACVASTSLAYAALAWYDRIALLHVGKVLSWPVVSVVSFVAYALGHNIGVSVLSSGVVRYRAYSRMGLSVGEVAIVTAFCAFTFGYGALFLGGIVLTGEPSLVARVFDLPTGIALAIGLAMLAAVALYQVGAVMRFKPLHVWGLHIEYPRPGIAFRQLFAAPIEIVGAAGIIYFALPDAYNPGFFIVLGAFLTSFCAGLVAQAPGGLGVFEYVFILVMPEVPKAELLAALIVFRLLYLLIPLAMSCVVVLLAERRALADAIGVAMGRRPAG